MWEFLKTLGLGMAYTVPVAAGMVLVAYLGVHHTWALGLIIGLVVSWLVGFTIKSAKEEREEQERRKERERNTPRPPPPTMGSGVRRFPPPSAINE